MNNISRKIIKLRADHDLTQSQLAKIAGVTNKAISAWEHGTREPKIKPIQKICAYFGIDLNTFIDEHTESGDYLEAAKAEPGKKEPTLITESGPLDSITAQIMDIVCQMSPEERRLYLENLKTLRLLQEQGRKPDIQE